MGLLSWLFPSDEDKLERARGHLAKGRFNDARELASDLTLHGAAEVVEQAEEALAKLNLAHAVSWAEAGDAERVAIHLELAAEFRKPGMEEDFAAARREIQDIEGNRQALRDAEAAREAAVLAQIDPRFRDEHGEEEIPLPDALDDDEAEAMKARLAILLDSYPAELRGSMISLGAPFAQAVIDLEDGRADDALPTLVSLPDDDPLVLHERARAAHALGDPGAAARAWLAFARVAGGHHPIGNHHTAVLLAQVQAESGDIRGGLETLTQARRADADLGGGLYASLLEATGDLAGAEKILRDLLRKFGAQPQLYLAIARVRLKGEHRVEAMQALEKSLDQTVCTPGRCGYRPPDLATYRLLATLYLEDNLEPERALELAETARTMVQRPTWDDLYLAALVARAQGAEQAPALAAKLHEVTPEQDPRIARLHKHLPMAS